MKPRAAPVITRRVVEEDIVSDAEDLPLGEETVMSLDEEEQESAFDERTGEINWDCPCLGGMAHGPCGEEFKKAFSCFIFSEQEPKGIECVDLFKDMQDCFRKHPEVYAEEIEADNAADAEAQSIADEAPSATTSA
ncbi:Oxidoreductase [Malassezia furfur]|uniref:Mitochondrial intermembrane space import and assembly protein 40 n=1 Tax=Malassezia furfur TaxID=55194 RepID=A0ABY8ETQ3_MALFU|nr:Oxidoreductase [Malassezia furfur]